ncbi:Electron transport protein HydN [compost metagenome]
MEVVVNQGYGSNGVAYQRAQANKCDLCHGREAGPACVEVCPTAALTLIRPADLQAMQLEKQQRAARGSAPNLR